VGFVVEKVTLVMVFSEYIGFTCQFLFHRLLHTHHHPSSGAGTIGQLAANVPSGLSLLTPQETEHPMKLLHIHILVSLEYTVVFQTRVPHEPPVPAKLDCISYKEDNHPE
jgi:hypothetical protein